MVLIVGKKMKNDLKKKKQSEDPYTLPIKNLDPQII